MQPRRGTWTIWARARLLALLVVGVLALTYTHPSVSQAHAPAMAARMGAGNHVILGDRATGLYLEVTVTGMELGDVSYEGYGNHRSEGVVTATTVTIQGTAYNALGNTNLTRPSMRASLGTNSDCDNVGKTTWPPPEMLDANGLMGGPYEAEMPFSFSYQVQRGNDRVCFVVQTGMNGGVYEGWKIQGIGWVDPNNPPIAPEATPITPPATSGSPSAPQGGKPPCTDPLFFYPDQDFGQWYTGQPSINYDCQGLSQQLVNGLKQYQAEGGTLSDGTLTSDAWEVPMAYANGWINTGKQGQLQDLARGLAREAQQVDPDYRLDPGTFFYLSLRLNGGNVRNALATCHAATMRAKGAPKQSGINKKFVEEEGILQPLRNPGGYADTTLTYKTPAGETRKVNPRQTLAADEQGAWYHLYGTAVLEFTDQFGTASVQAAKRALWATGWYADAAKKVEEKGFPVTGHGGVLGDFAVALEEAIRSREGSPPDVDKQCINYWGLSAGAALKARLKGIVAVDAPVECTVYGHGPSWITPETPTVGAGVYYQSPLSLRVDGTNGEWFAFDQAEQRFDGNTAMVVTHFIPEDDGTMGLIAIPLFTVASVQMTGTADGDVHLALYDPDTRRTSSYRFLVQTGDEVDVTWHGGDKVPVLNGSPLQPFAVNRSRRALPVWPVVGAAGGVLLVGGAAVMLRRRSARSRRERPSAVPLRPAPSPVPNPPAAAPAGLGTCESCGASLNRGAKFCGNCGAAVPPAQPVCPRCGQPASPGVRFCGNCGSPLGASQAAAPAPAARAPYVAPPAPGQPTMVPASPPAAQPSEPILAVVPTLSLRKGMLKFLEYNLVVTSQRLVFARVTTKMIQDAAKEAKEAVRSQGQGFMQQWAASTDARQYICDRYRREAVDSILAQDADSFFYPLQQVREIRTGSDSDGDDNTTDWLQVQTTTGKVRFTLHSGGADGVRKALKPLLGDLVR